MTTQENLIFQLEHLFKKISFNRYNFHPKRNSLFTRKISELNGINIINKKLYVDYEIVEISSHNKLRENSILFTNSLYDATSFPDNFTLITSDENFFNSFDKKNIFLVKDLNFTYNEILNFMYYHEDNIDFNDTFDFVNGSYISKFSYVNPTAKIFNSVISRGVVIGKNSIIKNNCVIKNSIIGENVIVCDGTIIGSTGFGFDLKKMGSLNINPQLGIVYIDDNCHIGSNCTIDRAKIDFTYLGKNSMLDNLVHLGHNVIIRDSACIAAQSGISGSVTIGKNLISGGQSGYAGHILLGDYVTVAAKSGVTKNINSHSIVAGFPATDIKEWKKMIIRLRKNGHK